MDKTNKIKNLFEKQQQKILFLILVLFGIFAFSFLITTTWIGLSVKQKCIEAREQYHLTDCSESLISYLEDTKNPVKKRSQAVWALGQLGDKKALPVLEKYYDASECDHENKLCQYELKKAIKLLDGGFNITAFVWRHNL